MEEKKKGRKEGRKKNDQKVFFVLSLLQLIKRNSCSFLAKHGFLGGRKRGPVGTVLLSLCTLAKVHECSRNFNACFPKNVAQ